MNKILLIKRRRPKNSYNQILGPFEFETNRICRKYDLEFVFYKGKITVWNPYKKGEVELVKSDSNGWQELVNHIIEYGNALGGYDMFSYMNGDNKCGIHYRNEDICKKWEDNLVQIWEENGN